jgi:4-hydroxy-tetrahydrodipicolinate synthase
MPPPPVQRYLSAAVATPLAPDLRPDAARLAGHARRLFAQGVDGITLFGTTGEGPGFSMRDRMATLEALVAGGISPERIIVAVGALAIEDSIALARHATRQGVRACLLMTPCLFRSGLTEDGIAAFYRAFLEATRRDGVRLMLYNFPDISGATLSPALVRRLVAAYPDRIVGLKDSGPDLDLTIRLVLGFAGLEIFTGNEIDLPDLAPLGVAGTICGLANIMPAFMRALTDAPNPHAGRALVAVLREADAILSRFPFVAAAKAILAEQTGDPAWLRTLPPLAPPRLPERARLTEAFHAWETRVAPLLARHARGAQPHGRLAPLRIA